MLFIAAAVLAASALLTSVARRVALARGLLDVPNARSSHGTSTPRGGGVAIALVTSTALLLLVVRGSLGWDLFAAAGVGGLAVAAVGLADDRRPLPSSLRLIVHVAAAAWAIAWLGGLPPLRVGNDLTQLGWGGDVLGVLGIVWVLNLFNFMDGIDGLAASEAMFVMLGGVCLIPTGPASAEVVTMSVVLAAASCGFLLWNWPPAKIFLGDVGSGYLGYMLAIFAVAATRTDPVAVWVWLILGGAFFVDATTTLVRRALRGERVYEAHRSHAYQWLARRWRSHRRVSLALLFLNLGWLFPWAAYAAHHPAAAVAAVAVALVSLVFLALASGSGRPEMSAPRP
jgi:Fuc2NAc and GlcNAc transferase